ncbi:MAG: dienelactone hydrolase family protein [Oscillochloris sp.]|nr:dienelactone hydrolase family protein [Oscillochloris sp.]
MCYQVTDRPPLPPVATMPAQSTDLELTAADGNRFAARLALPDAAPLAQVLVLPDVRGLHGFYQDLADRFASVGVAALALDYFGRTAGITPRDEGFDFWPHVHQLQLNNFFIDAVAALTHMRAATPPGTPTFTVGFCMGGTLSFLCGTQDFKLNGVVGFYSGFTRDFGDGKTLLEQASLMKVPALGMFGGDDPGIPAEQTAQFDAALDTAGVAHEVITYPGAPHSFFDRKAEQFAAESADAWRRVLRFFGATGA